MAHIAFPPVPRLSGAAWRGVRYFCTQRQGGVSPGSLAALNLALHVHDDPANVAINRARLASQLPSAPVWLNQVHGAQVWDADQRRDPAMPPPAADAAVCTQSGRVLVVMSADCLPVVIADEEGRAVGVAHAGWRGLAAGVLENTVESLRGKLPACKRLKAWIGPAIGQPHFEVGNEVRERFVDQDAGVAMHFLPTGADGKWLADLAGIARHRLTRAGVDSVESCGRCTFADAVDFYSHRRDSGSGRMATVAWLEAP